MKSIVAHIAKSYMQAAAKDKAAITAFGAAIPAGTIAADAIQSTQALSLSKDSDSRLVSKAQKAFDAGYSTKEVEEFLKSQNLDPYRTYWTMRNAMAPQIQAAKESGYSDEDLYQYFQEEGLGYLAPRLPKAVADQYRSTSDLEGMEEVEPISYHPDVVNSGVTETDLARIKGNPEELLRAANQLSSKFALDVAHRYIVPDSPGLQAIREEANYQARDALLQAGFSDARINKWGEAEVIDPETGEWTAYENPWYIDLGTSLRDSAGELVGGVGLAHVATSLAPQSRIAKVGAGIAGAMIGGALGRGYDVLKAASTLNTQIAAKELALHMGDAAASEMAVALGIGSLSQLTSAGLKGTATIYDRFVTGNRAGAFEAAKAYTNLNDAQIIDLLDKWEAVTGNSVRSVPSKVTGELTIADKGKALEVMGQTTPGMEASVNAALNMSRSGGATLAKQISDRAKSLDSELEYLTNDNVATFVTEGLNTYEKQVKAYFDLVKKTGVEQADDAGFRFDYQSIQSIDDYLTRTQESISNYALRSELAVDLENIRRLGGKAARDAALKDNAIVQAKSTTVKGNVDEVLSPEILEAYNPNRSLGDLIELRKVVNRLSSNKQYSKFFENTQVFKETIDAIDGEIAEAAKLMDEGDKWLNSWKQANTEYHKMLTLQKNALYKALTKETVTHDSAVKAFANALNYEGPQTYMQVMATLPPKTRRSVESSVVKHYIDSNTISMSDEVKAIDFPKLNQQLSNLALTNDDARKVKRMVKEMASLYRNDPNLVEIAWSAPAASPRNNIATSLIGKLKMQFATKAFHMWQALAPFKSSQMLALTLQMRKVIDNPLDAKAVQHLKATLGTDPELETQLHRYAIEYAKFGKNKDYGKAKLYRVAMPGNADTASETVIGKGVLTYLDKTKADKLAKDLGAKVTSRETAIKAIARPSDVEAILGRPPTPADLKNQQVMDKLRANFLGYAQDDKVILFKE